MHGDYQSSALAKSPERSSLGVSPREARVLTVVMSFERVYGYAPAIREVEKFLARICADDNARTAPLIRFGWLYTVSTQPCHRVAATQKCWDAFGFTKEMS